MHRSTNAIIITFCILFILLGLFVTAYGQTTVYYKPYATPTPTPTPSPTPTPTPDVTWTGVSNMTHGAGYLYADGTDGVATSVQTINSGGSGYFEFDGTSTVVVYWQLQLMPASGSPYSAFPSTSGIVSLLVGTASGGGYEPYMYGLNWYYSGGHAGDNSWTADTKVRIGFDGAGHMRVWKDGTPIYTTSGTYSAADYVLVISSGDSEVNGNGIENVIVVQ